jgi:pilus assembly protein Flp/PilA
LTDRAKIAYGEQAVNLPEQKEKTLMLEKLKRFVKDEEAPTAVEYAIMVAGVAVVIIAVVFLLGGKVNNTFSKVANHVGN